MGQLATVATVFPGIVYGMDWRALDRDRPDLTQLLIDVAPARSIVTASDPESDAEVTDTLGRTWLLSIGARWGDIPGAERYAVLSMLRCGQSVLLLAADLDDEADVRAGLLQILSEDSMAMGRFGHA